MAACTITRLQTDDVYIAGAKCKETPSSPSYITGMLILATKNIQFSLMRIYSVFIFLLAPYC